MLKKSYPNRVNFSVELVTLRFTVYTCTFRLKYGLKSGIFTEVANCKSFLGKEA